MCPEDSSAPTSPSTPSLDSAEQLCELARPLIQAKVRRLVKRAGITRSDGEDFEQVIYLRLLERFPSLPPSCHPLAFIAQVANQAIANELRHRNAQKRTSRGVTSLDAVAAGGTTSQESESLAASISQADLDARLGRLSRSAVDRADLGMDLDEEIARLSREQQELCTALGIETVAELVRRLGPPRSTLQDRVRKLRRKFEDGGLDAYLE